VKFQRIKKNKWGKCKNGGEGGTRRTPLKEGNGKGSRVSGSCRAERGESASRRGEGQRGVLGRRSERQMRGNLVLPGSFDRTLDCL